MKSDDFGDFFPKAEVGDVAAAGGVGAISNFAGNNFVDKVEHLHGLGFVLVESIPGILVKF